VRDTPVAGLSHQLPLTAALEGRHSGGRRWAAAAAAARRDAATAHAAAAEEIRAFNTQHKEKGRHELDLHGLHVKEALHALWARVQGARAERACAVVPRRREGTLVGAHTCVLTPRPPDDD
jgi:hypothetical protein